MDKEFFRFPPRNCSLFLRLRNITNIQNVLQQLQLARKLKYEIYRNLNIFIIYQVQLMTWKLTLYLLIYNSINYNSDRFLLFCCFLFNISIWSFGTFRGRARCLTLIHFKMWFWLVSPFKSFPQNGYTFIVIMLSKKWNRYWDLAH